MIMNRYLYILLFLLVSVVTQTAAQSTDQNYIQTTTYLNNDRTSPMHTVRYFDGLGRPVQQVRIGFTPNQTDWVTFQEYDAYGREWKSWLPVNTGSGSGHFRDLEDLKSRTNTAYGTEAVRYSETQYEPSPLNRVEKQYGPGQAWRTAGRSVQTAYLTNNADDYPCRYYSVSGNDLIKNASDYATGSLFVTQITDEDNKVSYEFKDKLDRVVLQRQVDTDGNYDTYYVYDDFNNLRFVLPPMIGEDISSTNLSKYAYSYKYDDRNRCTEMKWPGADPVYYVYDQADRLVFSQNGEQRLNNYWTFNKYDIFGRLILTGVWTNTPESQLTLTNKIKNTVVVESYSGSGSYGYTETVLTEIPASYSTVLQVNYYDHGDHLLNTLDAATKGKVNYTPLSGYDNRYENSDCPACSSKGLLVGTRVRMLDNTKQEIVTAYYYDAKGRVVQQKSTNLLEGSEAEYYAYSFTGNPIVKKHIHSAAGKPDIDEVYSYSYDHANRPTTTHYQLDNNPTLILLSNLVYDELGRVSRKELGNGERMTYTYNIRNWLKKIDCPNVFTETLYYEDAYAGNTPLYNGNISATAIDNGFWANNLPPEDEDVAFYPAVNTGYNYQYDGLNRLKKSQFTENGRINDLFNEEFTYDKQGNILTLKRNAMIYPQFSPQQIDDLTMEYTGNQLKKVQEAVPASRPYGFVRPSGNPESEYAYNRNGAMTKDFNRGIENISYNVLNLPNKIYFTGLNSTQYSYDATGVKRRTIHTTVENRTLVALQPQPVVPLAAEATTFSIPVNRHIRAGIIKVSIQPSTTQTVTDYCGNIVYENGELKYILNPEGYAYKTGNDIRYDYYIRDHLGNNWKAGNQINNYYPSGMVNSFISSNSERQPYKFGNKELDEMHGLNTYDQVTRQFGTIIPVTPTMDLLAEKNYSTSPYSQYGNNPVKYVDPDGRDIRIWYISGYDNRRYGGEIWKSWIFNGTNQNQAPSNQYIQDFLMAYKYDVENGGGENVYNMANSREMTVNLKDGGDNYNTKNNTVFWNPRWASTTKEGYIYSPATTLEHEMDHASAYLTNPTAHDTRVATTDQQYDNKEERRVITGAEAKTAQANGEFPQGYVRTDHAGYKSIRVSDPTQTNPMSTAAPTQRQPTSSSWWDSFIQWWNR
ncbi:hypothetical protein FACS189440_18680 [Bacteroidia bacterium]|nr:hypothetical protein FACS189440_18680 [Bacteroidia bacterium]